MEIRRVNVLEGPNIWTNYKALEVWVDIGKFEDFPSHTLNGFPERMMTWLPSMIEHRCGLGHRGGFFRRLVTGTYLGHILEHTTLELQSLAGIQAGFGRARETSERGVYKVVIEFLEPEVTLAAMQSAQALIMAAIDDRPFDVNAEVAKIRAIADQVCLGAGTGAIVKAAQAKGIPIIRLNPGSLVQLGYCSAQKRIWTAETDTTSAVAENIAQDKRLTGQLLSAVGIPVPCGEIVASADAACTFAESEGYPVVVKPVDGNHGRGVSINIRSADDVRVAYDLAAKEGTAVVVERMVPGIQHRVLVVGSKVVAVSRADPDQVTGDGVNTISQLIAEANKDPLRGSNGLYPLSTLVLDDIALNLLKQQGFAANTVPAAGQAVVLNYNGDCVTDATDEIHPDVAAQCVLAAQTVGLNIAGIDLIVENIAQPLSGQRGAIIEVNASPSLILHVRPLNGSPQPVGEAIVANLFEPAATGRVPLVAVTGTNGKTSTVDLLEQILMAAGRQVGVANSDGIRTKGRTIAHGECADFPSARRVLVNPFVDCAVLEVSAASVLRQGLGFDRCQVAIVTNLGSGDHLGAKYVETLDVMTRVKRAPVDVVLPEGTAVLNADDAVVAGLSEYCEGRTLFFGRSIRDAAVRAVLAGGGQVVTIDGDHIVVADAKSALPIAPVMEIPHAAQGRHQFQLENCLAAIAGAHALGLAPQEIQRGLKHAATHVRARFAYFELRGAHVVVSLCRNLSALEATMAAIDATTRYTSGTALYATFADQGVAAARAQGVALSRAFDTLVCGAADAQSAEDHRLADELSAAFRAAATSKKSTLLKENPCTAGRIAAAVQSLAAGQLLLVQAHDVKQLESIREQLSILGGHNLATGLTPGEPISLLGRESSGYQNQSNNA